MSKYIKEFIAFQEEIDRLRAELAWVREANNKHTLLRSEAFEENHQLRAEVEQLQAELKYMTTQRNVWKVDEQSRCRDVAILQKENDELTMAVAEYTVMSEALKGEMQVVK
jgi:uncharacterized small protein (DUF1192 family)